jgi:hypothetical protein
MLTIHVLMLAMIGGIAKHLDGYIQKRHLFSWRILYINALVSMFSGYTTAETVIGLTSIDSWVLVSAALGGFAGTEVLEAIFTFFQGRFFVHVDENNNQSDTKKPRRRRTPPHSK